MHQGTNDVKKNKDDPNQVILEVSSAVSNIKRQFPEAEIAFSNILQRRGKSPAISQGPVVQSIISLTSSLRGI